MSCPLFVDYTRTCISNFKTLVEFTDYSFCESEGYKDCIFYRSIKEPTKRCKFSERCIGLHMNMPTDDFKLDIHGLNEMGKYYCFNDNRTNCAIYKKFEAGEEVSPFLHPDGSLVQKAQV